MDCCHLSLCDHPMSLCGQCPVTVSSYPVQCVPTVQPPPSLPRPCPLSSQVEKLVAPSPSRHKSLRRDRGGSRKLPFSRRNKRELSKGSLRLLPPSRHKSLRRGCWLLGSFHSSQRELPLPPQTEAPHRRTLPSSPLWWAPAGSKGEDTAERFAKREGGPGPCASKEKRRSCTAAASRLPLSLLAGGSSSEERLLKEDRSGKSARPELASSGLPQRRGLQ